MQQQAVSWVHRQSFFSISTDFSCHDTPYTVNLHAIWPNIHEAKNSKKS